MRRNRLQHFAIHSMALRDLWGRSAEKSREMNLKGNRASVKPPRRNIVCQDESLLCHYSDFVCLFVCFLPFSRRVCAHLRCECRQDRKRAHPAPAAAPPCPSARLFSWAPRGERTCVHMTFRRSRGLIWLGRPRPNLPPASTSQRLRCTSQPP